MSGEWENWNRGEVGGGRGWLTLPLLKTQPHVNVIFFSFTLVSWSHMNDQVRWNVSSNQNNLKQIFFVLISKTFQEEFMINWWDHYLSSNLRGQNIFNRKQLQDSSKFGVGIIIHDTGAIYKPRGQMRGMGVALKTAI